MKKGFSLAELMIVLVVAGTIAALTIPVIVRDFSDTDKILYKSAFKLVESVVSELVSDLSLYPTGELSNTFCTNFKNKVNTIGTPDCTTSLIPGTPNVTTTNGMRWYGFTGTMFSADPVILKVDVNGPSKGNNVDGEDILQIQVYKSGKVSAPDGTEANYLTN